MPRPRRGLPVLLPLAAGLLLVAPAARAQYELPPAPREEVLESAPTPVVPRAPEPPSPAFGAAGEWVVTGASSVGAGWTQYDNSKATTLSLVFSPGFDVFIARNVSLGLSVNASYSDARGYDTVGDLISIKSTDLFFGVRLGANLPLGPAVSLWPRLTIGPFYDRTDQGIVTPSGTPGGPASETGDVAGVSGGLFVPLLIHPVPHFFVGFGPNVFHAFSQTGSGVNGLGDKTEIDGQLVVGGFWGGSPPPPAPAANAETTPAGFSAPLRFGSRGNVVLSAESSLGLTYATYSGPGGHNWSVGVGPGLDYFIADHVSLGGMLAVQADGNDASDVGGVHYTRTDNAFQLGARIGVELPLGSFVSLFPRATLGFQHVSSDLKEAGAEEIWGTDQVWVGLYAPVLAHVASHFFVGLGPYVSRDLTQTTSFQNGPSESNPGTRVGASLMVGGWL